MVQAVQSVSMSDLLAAPAASAGLADRAHAIPGADVQAAGR